MKNDVRRPCRAGRFSAFRRVSLMASLLAFAALASNLPARDITTLDGKVYKNVSIDVKPNGLELIHSTGVAFVNFKRLPENIRKEFGYDPVKAAEYEKKEREARQAREKFLAEQRAKAAEAKKRKDAERAAREKHRAARLADIREEILLNGDLYCMTSNKLYDAKGAKMMFTFTKKGNLVPGNGRYHLIKNIVHMINGNAAPVEGVVKSLEAENKILEHDIASMEKSLVDAAKRIDDNHARIAEILTQANVSIVNYYDAQGNFIGYQYIQNVLSDAQIRAIRHLDSENSAIRRAMRKTATALDNARTRRTQVAERSAYLAAQLAAFRKNQKNYRAKYAAAQGETPAINTPPAAKEPTTEDQKLEHKLAKLKEMFDKGLIPEDVYKEKVANAIDSYLGQGKKSDAP